VDVSDFFARSRLSGLRSLNLHGRIQISTWDHLASRTTLLTTLSIEITTYPPSPAPTIFQLSSILTSNPNLQRLILSNAALPDTTDGSELKVPLHKLKVLSLAGEIRRLFGLLHQLLLPEMLDRMDVTGFDSTVDDVSQTLIPYMRDYIGRDARFRDTLEVSASSSSPDFVAISVAVAHNETATLELDSPYVSFEIYLDDQPPPDVLEQLFINLFAPIPRGHAVRLSADLGMKLPDELLFTMPNVEMLHIFGAELSKGFLQPNPDGPHPNAKLLPLLETLSLEDVILGDGDWSNLTTYLTHQTSDGQAISLEMAGEIPYMRPEVENEIQGLVRAFIYQRDQEAGEGE